MNALLPVLGSLAVLAIFGVGALFGAWISESDQKRVARRPRLMELVEDDGSADYTHGGSEWL